MPLIYWHAPEKYEVKKMKTVTKGKAPAGTNREAFESKLNLTLDGKFKGFDVFDSIEVNNKKQCNLCNPPLISPRRSAKLCPSCTSEQTQEAAAVLNLLSTPRQPIRTHRCSGCQRCVVPARFSQSWGICKRCVVDALTFGLFDVHKAKGSNRHQERHNGFAW